MSIQLKANDLVRSFRISRTTIPVLRGVSLEISSGEAVFLCGASGAGKTTLLYTLAGLETPESGTVEFEGSSLYTMGSDRLTRLRNRRMGFVFQSYFLLPELTALENVLVPAMIGGKCSVEKGTSLLERVGLSERLHHLPAELSGGEQQRVAIARALVRAPRVILADEPTGNLDERTRDDIIGLLEQLWRERGQTLIVVTHDTWVASRASRRIWLDRGRLGEEPAAAVPGLDARVVAEPALAVAGRL